MAASDCKLIPVYVRRQSDEKLSAQKSLGSWLGLSARSSITLEVIDGTARAAFWLIADREMGEFWPALFSSSFVGRRGHQTAKVFPGLAREGRKAPFGPPIAPQQWVMQWQYFIYLGGGGGSFAMCGICSKRCQMAGGGFRPGERGRNDLEGPSWRPQYNGLRGRH